MTTGKDNDYIAEVIGLDGERVFKKQLAVSVFNASIVDFTIDKEFSLPTVPVMVKWDVKHASKVWIEGIPGMAEIEHKGEAVIEPDKNTTLCLKVEDKFGTDSYKKTIRMLPLPIIKSLLRPEPKVTNTINVGVKLTRPQMKIKTPTNVFASLKPFVMHVQIPPLSIQMPFVEGMTAPSEGWFTKGYKQLSDFTHKLFDFTQIIKKILTKQIPQK